MIAGAAGVDASTTGVDAGASGVEVGEADMNLDAGVATVDVTGATLATAAAQTGLNSRCTCRRRGRQCFRQTMPESLTSANQKTIQRIGPSPVIVSTN
jgi:hypothetical protein